MREPPSYFLQPHPQWICRLLEPFSQLSKVERFTIAKWVGHRGTRMIEEVYGHVDADYRQVEMSKVRITGINGNGGGAK